MRSANCDPTCLGQTFYAFIPRVIDLGKFCDTDHVEYLLEVFGKARDPDLLVILPGLGKELNEN